MTMNLRILLIIGSCLSLLYIIVRIRKADIRFMDIFSWFVLSLLLIIMSLFPRVIIGLTHIFGFESPVNCIFLFIICFLIYKLFTMSIKISKEKDKMVSALEEIAINLKELRKETENENTVS